MGAHVLRTADRPDRLLPHWTSGRRPPTAGTMRLLFRLQVAQPEWPLARAGATEVAERGPEFLGRWNGRHGGIWLLHGWGWGAEAGSGRASADAS
jgi:hypothetical protein